MGYSCLFHRARDRCENRWKDERTDVHKKEIYRQMMCIEVTRDNDTN